MAAAAKFVAARSMPRTTHHRASAPLAASATTPVAVSFISNLPHKHEAVVATAGDRTHAMDAPQLACTWQEVQGADDWRGLVNPFHPLLRAEIVLYVELIADVALPMNLHFPCRKSRWIGYLAVASDQQVAQLGRRYILVSFRSTVTCSEWLANFMSLLAPARFDPTDPRPDVRVESGLLSVYTSDDVSGKFTTGSSRNQLLSEVSRLVTEHKHKHEDISITLAGHSMGSSPSLLLGYDLAVHGLNRNPYDGSRIPVTVFSFAGPRVGNLEFRNQCEELGVKVLRVVNVNDPVTKMPGFVFNENARALAGRYEMPWSKACYAHVGIEVALDFFKVGDIACVHDLDEYIDNLLKCSSDITVPHELVREDEQGVSGRVASLFNSWKWQMAAIRASELMQALGI